MPTRRVIFMGEKDLGLRCLKLLEATQGVELAAVCTRARRDVWWGQQELRDYCQARRIPVINRSQIASYEIDHLLSVLYPFMVEKQYINHARKGCFNLHEAPLPRWRGCNGYSHAILAGDPEYATTLHEMVPQLDAGKIVADRRFPILPNETSKELFQRTAEESYQLVKEWLPRLLEDNYVTCVPAPDEESFLNPRDSLLHLKEVALNAPILDVFRVARALDFVPWEPAFVVVGGRKYYLFLLDALGREKVKLQDPVKIPLVGQLAEVDWQNLTTGVIGDLPRPLVVCESEAYKQYFPIFGQVSGAVHAG